MRLVVPVSVDVLGHVRRVLYLLSTMSCAHFDGLFRKALKGLPATLLAALVDAELDNPVVLRSFPRATAARLGLLEGARFGAGSRRRQ